MKYHDLHPWDVSPKEAKDIQESLRHRLQLEVAPKRVDTVAGIDVSHNWGSPHLYAAVVILDIKKGPPFPVIEQAVGSYKTTFPYISGLLSFREIPVVLKAWEKLSIRPDCIVCDGQGIAHPRRFGIASHLGLIVNLPSIGCAKSRLMGTYQEPPPARGEYVPLVSKEEIVGAVLRSRKGKKPIYISQGHKITLHRAVEIILSTCVGYRLPEPTRMAHRLVNQKRLSSYRGEAEKGKAKPT